jgi:hypothetical protein
MKLNYNVTSAERKSLVGAISTFLNVPTKYLGAPTFAYEVGGYRISQTGTLTGEDNGELEVALLEQGFDATEREYDGEFPFVNGVEGVDQPKEEPAPRKGIMDIIVDTLNENAEDGEHWERLHSTPKMECGDGHWRNLDGTFAPSETPDPQGTFTVSLPYDGNPDAMARLVKLVIAKESLISNALGEWALDDLPIALGEEDGQTTVSLTWLFADAPQELKEAVVALAAALWKFCKKAQRVTAKETATDNEKFAMRTLLVRIGMNDITNKVHRKTLLQNLTGDSAFATPESKAKWLAKHGGKKYTEEVTDNAVSE